MKRKTNQAFTPIGNLVDAFMKTCRQSPDTRLTRIWQVWDHAVGGTIAENAQPEAFKGSLLIVSVSSSPWLQQLRFLKTDLINNINTALGGDMVSDIRFKIGSL